METAPVTTGSDRSTWSFLNLANPVLGALAGILIALPLAVHAAPSAAPFLVLPLFALGTMLGWRRRDSRLFLYVAMIAVLALAFLFLRSMPASESLSEWRSG